MKPAPMLFTARGRFDPRHARDWEGYLDFLGRRDLARVITLDTILCPPVIEASSPEDWSFLAADLAAVDLFTDLGFLRRRTATAKTPFRILAALREPTGPDAEGEPGPDFEFAGFDVVDVEHDVSALLNCGGFPEVFSVEELASSSGLLTSIERAYEVRDELLRRYPDHDHARCHVWAVWVMVER